MMVYIYDLSDPRTGHVRYVGKSVSPTERLVCHIRKARKGSKLHSHCWIAGLLTLGLRPNLSILDEVDDKDANEVEIFWIASLKLAGAELTNKTFGGDGQSLGYRPTDEARKKQSIAQRANGGWSDAHRSAHAAALASPETRAKMSAARKGKPLPHGMIEAARIANTGRRLSEESRKKIGDANKGRKQSQETIAKRMAKISGKPRKKGWKHTDEAKARIGAASKERGSASVAMAARWG